MPHLSPPSSLAGAIPSWPMRHRAVKEPWGWIELFAAIQILWGALLFVPGVQPYRMYIRALPYVASLGALVCRACAARRASRCRRAAKWLLASFALLAANLLHRGDVSRSGPRAGHLPDQHRRADVLGGADDSQSEARLARLLWIILAASFVSAAVGVLQVYYSRCGSCRPNSARWRDSLNPAIIDALSYVGPDGRPIIRPPGLSDLPGGAAVGGLIAVVLGIAFVSHDAPSSARQDRSASVPPRSA